MSTELQSGWCFVVVSTRKSFLDNSHGHHICITSKICKEATKSADITQIDNIAWDKLSEPAVKAELRRISLFAAFTDQATQFSYNPVITEYGQFPLRNTDEIQLCHTPIVARHGSARLEQQDGAT